MTAHETDEHEVVGRELNGLMAREVVRLLKRRTGRGPTLARAFYRDNIFVVVLEQALTPGEQLLAREGDHDAAKWLRGRLTKAMRPELVSLVERLTGARVESFVAGTEIQPDCSTLLFVMDRRIDPGFVVSEPHRVRLVE